MLKRSCVQVWLYVLAMHHYQMKLGTFLLFSAVLDHVYTIGYNETCETGGIPCQANLICQYAGGATTCVCQDSQYWNINNGLCTGTILDNVSSAYCNGGRASGYNETCELGSESCHTNLVCSTSGATSVCLCDVTHYWDASISTCIKKSGYNEMCVLGGESCLTNLVCYASVCVCDVTQYWDAYIGTCITKSGYKGACDAADPSSCLTPLVCSGTAQGESVCLCQQDEYWNVQSALCKAASYFNQSCDPESEGSCVTNLICVNDVCTCSDNQYWDEISQTCMAKPVTSDGTYNAPCTQDVGSSLCLDIFNCVEVTKSDLRCLCSHGGIYLDNACYYGAVSATTYSMPMTFYEARDYCFARSSYLADDNHFEQIFKNCFNSTAMFHSGNVNLLYAAEDATQCSSVQIIQGNVIRSTYFTCHIHLPFVCIKKEFGSANNECKIFEHLGTLHSNESFPALWAIVGAVGAVLVVGGLIAVVIYITRRKGKNKDDTYPGNTLTAINVYDSVKSGDLEPRRTKQTGKENGRKLPQTDREEYSHPRLHHQEGQYDTFAKLDHQGAAVYDRIHDLKIPNEAPEQSMSSHIADSGRTGEYDKLTLATKDTKVGGFDRVHKEEKENHYDTLTIIKNV